MQQRPHRASGPSPYGLRRDQGLDFPVNAFVDGILFWAT